MYNTVNSSFFLEEYYARLQLQAAMKPHKGLTGSQRTRLIEAAQKHYDRVIEAIAKVSFKERA